MTAVDSVDSGNNARGWQLTNQQRSNNGQNLTNQQYPNMEMQKITNPNCEYFPLYLPLLPDGTSCCTHLWRI